MLTRITKRTILKEVNNDMCHNYYYLVNVRIYNNDMSLYRRFRFIVWFDAFDLQEWYENEERITKDMVRSYVDEQAYNFADNMKSFSDPKHFMDMCNATLEDYNRTFEREYYNISNPFLPFAY